MRIVCAEAILFAFVMAVSSGCGTAGDSGEDAAANPVVDTVQGDVPGDDAGCLPKCDTECGPDGCGGVCSICKNICNGEEEPDLCQDGWCAVPACCPDCTGKECGSDGCSGSCGECGDDDPCNGVEECKQGQCVIGQAPDCDDHNPCTSDSCGPPDGCNHETVEDGPFEGCDDGNPCTVDACDHGACVNTLKPLEELLATECLCQTDEDCTALEDGDLCNGTLVCDDDAEPSVCAVDPDTIVLCGPEEGQSPDCVHVECGVETGECVVETTNEEEPCEDDSGVCLDGICCKPDCDGKECGDDGCIGECGSCSDPLECMEAGCEEGQCASFLLEGFCLLDGETCVPAGNQQENNECMACRPDLNSESWTAVDNGQLCDDADPCTAADACIEGLCSGTAIDCDDAFTCTMDACVEGVCKHEADDAVCDDDIECSVDSCHVEEGCQNQPDHAVCDDGIDCTVDTCDPLEGCQNVADHQACDDTVDCTVDTCDPLEGCQNVPDDVACDDSVECTVDSCDAKAGCLNDPQADLCNDQLDCTIDSCHPQVDCQNLPDHTLCNDNVGCTIDSCAPDLGCLNEANHSLCDDEIQCTSDTCSLLDDCQNTAEHAVCDDNQECTVDLCDPQQGCQNEPLDGPICELDGICIVGQCCHPACDGKQCGDDGCNSTCQPGCDDQLERTQDACQDGLCSNDIEAGHCVVDGACVGHEIDHPDESCLWCQAKQNATGWTAKEDGTACGAGKVCFEGGCCDVVTNCTGQECGDDGCGSLCGVCVDWPNSFCTPDGLCDCVEGCANKQCGDDGCGGVCGTCDDGTSCQDGQCMVQCGDQLCGAGEDQCNCPEDCAGGCDGCCAGKFCKSGESATFCGTGGEACEQCNDLQLCNGEDCICTPEDHKECVIGDIYWVDACGEMGELVEDCGNHLCLNGQCQPPSCSDSFCNGAETPCDCPQDCGAPCDGKSCGDDGCGGTCGACGACQDCQNGACKTVCWSDPTSGLTWQNPPTGSMKSWDGAKQYCENLTLWGNSDWQLPTIDHMRTLIRGCPATEPGGSCNASETDCVSWSCVDGSCSKGCAIEKGPAGGNYWPDGMSGSGSWTWSSTTIVDHTNYAYGIFYNAAQIYGGMVPKSIPGYLRCVNTSCLQGNCPPSSCPNGSCGGGESKCNCPQDCGEPCANKECGDDGCGGSCGTCAPGLECTELGTCFQPPCGDGSCGDDEDCATCPEDCGSCEGDCCQAHESIGCEDDALTACVCALPGNSFCCTHYWDYGCAHQAKLHCGLICL